MKKFLLDILVCPECVPKDISLQLSCSKTADNDIFEGKLTCPACENHYEISDGIAILLPARSRSVLSGKTGYNSSPMLSSYLWSHFSDLLNDSMASEAYKTWSSYFKKSDGLALDIGCSVGRLVFEAGKKYSFAIGIDTSLSFIKEARKILRNKTLLFDLIIEGLITEKRHYDFMAWDFTNIDFIVADALAVPFPKNIFSAISAMNLIEKVPDPVQHFREVNRVLNPVNATFLFSDPFSWDENFTKPKFWLSGLNSGDWKGFGYKNIRDIFLGKNSIMDPPFRIVDEMDVPWRIRKTRNLFEFINPRLIVGER